MSRSANHYFTGAGPSGPANYIEDVFSTYLYNGNGGTQIVSNGMPLGTSNAGGSVYFNNSSSNSLKFTESAVNTFGTGDFTMECWIYPLASAQTMYVVSGSSSCAVLGVYTGASGQLFLGNEQITNSAGYTGTLNIAINTWHHVAITRQSGTVKIYWNGVFQTTSTNGPADFTNPCYIVGTNNSGDSPVNGYVSNVRLVKGTAVYTANFTPSTTPLTALSGTGLLTCQGPNYYKDNSGNNLISTLAGTAIGSAFGPLTSSSANGGLVWIKARQSTGYHSLYDTSRGAKKRLSTITTGGEYTYSTTGLTQFNGSGFVVADDSNGGDNVNGAPGGTYSGTNANYVSWTFCEKEKFFDVVTWTGDGGADNRKINHNLNSAPGCVIVKASSADSTNWYVWHRSSGHGSILFLQDTQTGASYGMFNYTDPTTTQLNLHTAINANGVTYVAYLFAHDAGGFGLTGTDNVISCGSFIGNSSGVGTAVLGWEPQWVLIKNISGTANDWYVADNMRGLTTKGSNQTHVTRLNLANSDITGADYIEVNSTGFTTNFSAQTYIYIAIRKGPMKVPTVGTNVFSLGARAGTSTLNTLITAGFPVDLGVFKQTNEADAHWFWGDRLRGPLLSLTTSYQNDLSPVEQSIPGSVTGFDSNNGLLVYNASEVNTTGKSYVNFLFKRAPSFFDSVCYTGTGSNRNVSHNLGVAPELMIVKRRNDVILTILPIV